MTAGPEYELIVPARCGRAFEVRTGQYLTITDLDGRQVGDFVAFNAHDVTEYLHTAHTRMFLDRIYPRVGDRFVSTWLNPMLEIVRDDVGQHDMIRAWCNPLRYARRFGAPNHPSCFENLFGAVAAYGVEKHWMPMPVNIFQNSRIAPDGHFDVRPALSKPGDKLVLRAHQDLVCALSACPMDLIPTNGFEITDLMVTVTNRPPEDNGFSVG